MAWKGSVSARQQLLRTRQRLLAADADSRLGRLLAQFDSETRRFATLVRATPAPGEESKLRQEVTELAASIDGLRRQLSSLEPDFHRAWVDRRISPETLSDALPASAALVDLFEYEHHTLAAKKGGQDSQQRRLLAFVVRRDRPCACIGLGASDRIGKLVETWRAGLGSPDSDGKRSGAELRTLIWQPLQQQLADVQTVLISPDGAVSQLPWGALPGEKAGTYLIEQRAFAVAPIPQMLPELLKSPVVSGPPDSLLLTGDIDYGGDPGSAPVQAAAVRAVGVPRNGALFPPLAGAAAELASIRDWYERANGAGKLAVLQRQEATEGAFRSQAPDYRWLHLVTHGFFAPVLVTTATTAPPDPKTAAGIGLMFKLEESHCLATRLTAGMAAAKDGRIKPGDEFWPLRNRMVSG